MLFHSSSLSRLLSDAEGVVFLNLPILYLFFRTLIMLNDL